MDMAEMTKYIEADQAISAYGSFVCASVGRSFKAEKADALAAVAIVRCEEAAQDCTVNQGTRDHYRECAEILKTQIGRFAEADFDFWIFPEDEPDYDYDWAE